MKVYDIISESKSLNEGIKKWYVFAKLFGSGPRKEAAETLGKKWAKELYFDDAITTDASKILRGHSAKYANDKEVLDAAKVYAEEAAAKAGWAAKTSLAANVYRTGADGMLFLGHAAAAGFLFVPPAKEYFSQISIAEEKLAAKEITDEQFAAIRQHQASILTGRLIAALAAAGFSKGLFGPAISALRGIAKMNKSVAGPSSIIADLLSTAKIGTNVALASMLSSGTAANLIAELFSIAIVQETVGARAVDIADEFKSTFGASQPSDKVGKGDANKQSPAADAALAATSQAPVAPKYNPNAMPTSVNQIKDPKTGEIRTREPEEY